MSANLVEMTKRAGHVVYYSDDELKSKKIAESNARAVANIKARSKKKTTK